MPETGTQEQKAPSTPTTAKGFTRDTVPSSIPLSISVPNVLPGLAFDFKMKLKLSGEAQESREAYLALSQADQVTREADQTLTELCDLLVEMPKGFTDLQDNGNGPGSSFEEYVKSSTGNARNVLDIIVRGATTLYWNKLAPREFRR